ncbi:neuropathy target esterase sws-like [Centruroides vittatus]|uniref:neuropathy target esterase sws-like n=1 Tax=Centruroides vittatus TaxID=120091 RepID=UPI00350F8796
MEFKIWLILQNLIIAFISLTAIIIFSKILNYRGKNKKQFRKRDIIAFYLRWTVKKGKYIGNSIFHDTFQNYSISSIFRKLLRKQDQLSAAKKYEDASLLAFDESIPDLDVSLSSEKVSLPPEILYMLNSIRIFSFSEKPDFMELFKTFETIEIKEGQMLFNVGDPDDSIYVIKSGQVFLLDQDLILKIVNEGEYIASHLSILAVLTNNFETFGTVSAKAKTDCIVLKLPTKLLGDLLKKDQEALLRTVQLILIRLQRAIFIALYQHLGITIKLTVVNNLESEIKNTQNNICNPKELSFSHWLQKAITGFKIQLGIKDDIKLENFIEIIEYPSDYYLTYEDSSENNDLFYILHGYVQILQSTYTKKNNILCVASSESIIGGLAVLTGDPSLFTFKTVTTTYLGIIRKNDVYKILHETPSSVLNLANIIIKTLCPFVHEIDYALDWINIESGKALYRQDDSSEFMYILLNGRLRSILSLPDGKKEYVDEYGRGDLVGIAEFLTQRKRCTTVRTIRNSELAKISYGLMEVIKRKYPEVLQRFIYILGNSTLGSLKRTFLGQTYGQKIHSSKYSTVALLAETKNVPLSAFTLELEHALQPIARTLRLTSDFIIRTFGDTALDSANEYRFYNWLGYEEDHHNITLYQCDMEFSQWSKHCIYQADYILILAMNDQEPILSEIEKEPAFLNIKAQKELIILHKEDADKPLNTSRKLNIHGCNMWHHIRCPERVFYKKLDSRKKELSYKKLLKTKRSVHCDFSRLARFLTGTSYGLVLGGGGARGIAHIGLIKAILEADIPIDMVGGVSMGAFIGGLWCQETDITSVIQKAEEWAKKTSSWQSYLYDITFPRTAMFTEFIM